MKKIVQTDDGNFSISFAGNCTQNPYHYDLGKGFSIDGILYICTPFDTSYTTGDIKYRGIAIASYHLNKNEATVSSTVIAVARFKLRWDWTKGNLEYMRCDYNDSIWHPDYDCPDDWIVLLHVDRP